MYSPRLLHRDLPDHRPTSPSTPTAALESQISSLQLLLLSHLSPPPWLPPQYPHSELLRQWDFLRIKFGSEVWRALRGRAGSFSASSGSGDDGKEKEKTSTPQSASAEPTKFRRKYKATETALATCCAHLRRGIWSAFLPGLEETIDASLRAVEKRLVLHAEQLSQSSNGSGDDAALKAAKAAREWRIMTLGLLLQTQAESKVPLKPPSRGRDSGGPLKPGEKPLPPIPCEEEAGRPTTESENDAILRLAGELMESLVGESSPARTKKIGAAVKEIADSAVSLRVQKDEEGELTVFFPAEGEWADGGEVIEVGADVEEDDEEEEEVEAEKDGNSESQKNGDSQANGRQESGGEGAPLERAATGGSSGSRAERLKAGGGRVGRVVWPGLRHNGRVVRKAEVMFLAEEEG